MINFVRRILNRSYHPLNRIVISEKKLTDNYNYLSTINKKIKVVPVLKSNAYGHGILKVGKLVDKFNPPFLCVDSLYEAFQLHKEKVKTPILIMGYIDPRSLKVKKFPFSYAVWNRETAEALDKYQKGCEVHIFVDTGMHREGVNVDELEDFIFELKKLKNINVVGLMSHLASANNPKNLQNKEQVKNFKKALNICNKNHLGLKYKHLSASAGLLTLPNTDCNIARVGKALYGIDPLGDFPKLKPVLKFTSHVVQIKKLKKGGRVGYDGTFSATNDMVIGILPLGYNDGLDRRLSSVGIVQVNGVECPIIGMISMNVATIDLTNAKDVKVGDEVVIYSDNPKDKNSISNSAKLCNTTPYDIMVNLVDSTRREVG